MASLQRRRCTCFRHARNMVPMLPTTGEEVYKSIPHWNDNCRNCRRRNTRRRYTDANAQLYKINMNRPMPIHSAARLSQIFFFLQDTFRLQHKSSWVNGFLKNWTAHFQSWPYGSLLKRNQSQQAQFSIAYGILEINTGKTCPSGSDSNIVKAVNRSYETRVASGNNVQCDSHKEGYRELSEEEKNTFSLNEEV